MSYHQPKPKPSVMRAMSIEQALRWAFAVEKAAVDFDTWGAHEFAREGIDPIWRGMKMAALGCAVDGGGSSDPAADATIIAGAVEALPEGCGGRRMALQVVELARTRGTPDWGASDRLGIVPAGWDCKADGFHAYTEKTGTPFAWRDKYRKRHSARGELCPVQYTGTASSIAAKHRNYLLWISALLHLSMELERPGALHTIKINGALPEMSPWRKEGGNGK